MPRARPATRGIPSWNRGFRLLLRILSSSRPSSPPRPAPPPSPPSPPPATNQQLPSGGGTTPYPEAKPEHSQADAAPSTAPNPQTPLGGGTAPDPYANSQADAAPKTAPDPQTPLGGGATPAPQSSETGITAKPAEQGDGAETNKSSAEAMREAAAGTHSSEAALDDLLGSVGGWLSSAVTGLGGVGAQMLSQVVGASGAGSGTATHQEDGGTNNTAHTHASSAAVRGPLYSGPRGDNDNDNEAAGRTPDSRSHPSCSCRAHHYRPRPSLYHHRPQPFLHHRSVHRDHHCHHPRPPNLRQSAPTPPPLPPYPHSSGPDAGAPGPAMRATGQTLDVESKSGTGVTTPSHYSRRLRPEGQAFTSLRPDRTARASPRRPRAGAR
ncbi:hypothetical protein IAT38_003766 [Cryptococcus sp. DSM 104549]